ncbi:MAG: NUDIX domain-containing protein [Chloroflexota bacterium]|nr:NUDIX domain-containing protein [Chloroflexota bacterium]
MADQLVPQDPRERFDLVLPNGTPTGRTKARAEVHRDGDWHRAVHVWVAGVGEDGSGFLLFQRRVLGKDTWPGRLDATVGGHYRAGEGLAQALREVEEEIGITVAENDLRRLGVRLCVNEAEPGVRDHELQDVFLLRDDRPLTAYRPEPAELAALVRFPLPPLLDLLAGARETVTAESITPGSDASVPAEIGSADFIPTVDRYFYRVAVAVGLALRGETHLTV